MVFFSITRITDEFPKNTSTVLSPQISRLLAYILIRNIYKDLLLMYFPTAWGRVLEKLTGLQLTKKFPAFYGTRRFITAFTTARHLSLSTASSIQSIPPTTYFLKIHLNIIFPSTPGSPQCSLSLRFPHQTLYTPHVSPTRATCPAHLIHKNLIGIFLQCFFFYTTVGDVL